MRCHVCKNEIIVFTPAGSGQRPIPPATLKVPKKISDTGELYFCSADEEQIPYYERALELIQQIDMGSVQPILGMSKAETIAVTLYYGAR